MLNPLANSDAKWPTCGVVIQKEGENETMCPNRATQMVNMANPDDTSEIYAVLLICDEHDKALEEGKALIVAADNGERIGVSYKTKEE